MEKVSKKVSFPHMGNYFVGFRPIAELMADKVVVPPPITKKPLKLELNTAPNALVYRLNIIWETI